MKVSNYLSGAVRQFSYWFVHGTLGYPILEGIDYLSELDEDSSCMEQAFSIFMNNMMPGSKHRNTMSDSFM